MTRTIRFIVRSLAALAVLLGAAWISLGAWFRLPFSVAFRGIFVAALLTLALLAARAVATGQQRRFIAGFGVAVGLFAMWWSSIAASNERDWMADVQFLPSADFSGNLVTVRNVRNFEYRSETEFDERWEERTFDLSEITGIDLYLSYWSSSAIAHTIVSWEFLNSPPLAISIETRKERGESYSSIRGFFREYELYYVVADERDLVGLRTKHRGEQVFLYRVRMPVDVARALLIDYLEEANRLVTQPRWYNAATHNCTTAIRKHIQHVSAGNPFDWRVLVNGYLDELMYERGTVDTELPFADLKTLSDITERANSAYGDPEFSSRIRTGIPSP